MKKKKSKNNPKELWVPKVKGQNIYMPLAHVDKRIVKMIYPNHVLVLFRKVK